MTERQNRVTSLLAELAATFVRNEANPEPLITVMQVSVSPDYKRATIYITTIPDDREEEALIFLKRKAKDFRGYIKKHTNLKHIPHVEFELDRGERHRQHIDKIAKDIAEDS